MKIKTKKPQTAFEMAIAADTLTERLEAFAKRVHELDKQIAPRLEERKELSKRLANLVDKKLTIAGRFKILKLHINGGWVAYQRKPYDTIKVRKLRRLRTRVGIALALFCCSLSVHAQTLRYNPTRQDAIAVQRLPYVLRGGNVEAVPNFGPAYVHDGRFMAASTNLVRLRASLKAHNEELALLNQIQTPTSEQFQRRQQLMIWTRQQVKAIAPLEATLHSIEAEYELRDLKMKARPQ